MIQNVPQVGQGPQPTVNLPVTSGPPTIVPLALGEVVRGEVLNILPDAVSMRVKKEIILANANIPLRKGLSYLFRVESLSPNEVRLKVLQTLPSETEEMGNTILKALNNLKGAYLAHDEIVALKKTLEKIPQSAWKKLPELGALNKLFKGTASLTDGSFKASIDSTGNFFETKLRVLTLDLMEKEGLPEGKGLKDEIAQILKEDLKGNLLKLKQALQETDMTSHLKEKRVGVDEIATAVDKLLSHIEQQQLESKLHTVFQTFLPFVWNQLKDGKLIFKESYHAQEGGAEYACTIYLDLTGAGRLIAHLRLFGDVLHLGFTTQNPRFKSLIEENKPQLEKALSDIGLVCNSLIVTQEKEIDFDKGEPKSELDLKI